MSKLQHTPGPWKAKRFSVIKSNGYKITQNRPVAAAPEAWGEIDRTYEANARLIAAAPEMLIELLKSIAELDKTGFASITSETIIMKATGWSYDILNDVLTKLSTGMSIEEILK